MPYPVVYTPEPTRPSGGPQAGTLILIRWIVSPVGWDAADAHDDVDPTNLGVYNPRDVCGHQWPGWTCTGSQHARGAAFDAGFPVQRPHGHPEGHKLAAWLVEEHAALGIQEVIWADRRWHNGLGIIPHTRWPIYNGASDHFDHVHAAQTDQAARELTLAQIEAVAPQGDDMTPEQADQLAQTTLLAHDAQARLQRLEKRVGTDNTGADLSDEVDMLRKDIRLLLDHFQIPGGSS